MGFCGGWHEGGYSNFPLSPTPFPIPPSPHFDWRNIDTPHFEWRNIGISPLNSRLRLLFSIVALALLSVVWNTGLI